MRKQYIEPSLDMSWFALEDIMTASNGQDGDGQHEIGDNTLVGSGGSVTNGDLDDLLGY